MEAKTPVHTNQPTRKTPTTRSATYDGTHEETYSYCSREKYRKYRKERKEKAREKQKKQQLKQTVCTPQQYLLQLQQICRMINAGTMHGFHLQARNLVPSFRTIVVRFFSAQAKHSRQAYFANRNIHYIPRPGLGLDAPGSGLPTAANKPAISLCRRRSSAMRTEAPLQQADERNYLRP